MNTRGRLGKVSRRRRVQGWLALGCGASCFLALGCGGDDSNETQYRYCDASPILDEKCRRCHSDPPLNGAPFSLEGYEAVAQRTDQIGHVIEIDVMPFRGVALTPPVEDLTADEEALLLEWLAAGAPQGSPECE